MRPPRLPTLGLPMVVVTSVALLFGACDRTDAPPPKQPAAEATSPAPSSKTAPATPLATPSAASAANPTLPSAPDTTVVAYDGTAVNLSKLWAGHKTLLVFYRGHW